MEDRGSILGGKELVTGSSGVVQESLGMEKSRSVKASSDAFSVPLMMAEVQQKKQKLIRQTELTFKTGYYNPSINEPFLGVASLISLFTIPFQKGLIT